MNPAIDDIFQKAKVRLEIGEKKYGVFDPKTNKVNMYSEMEEELLDVINYACFEILKLREMDKGCLSET